MLAAAHKGGLSWSIDPPEHVELTREEIEERRQARKAGETVKTTRYAPMATKPRGAC
jgi:sRNA-binding carbon storage regulator CsrA